MGFGNRALCYSLAESPEFLDIQTAAEFVCVVLHAVQFDVVDRETGARTARQVAWAWAGQGYWRKRRESR